MWSLLSFVGTKTLTFLSMLVLARLLAPAQFGVLAAILAFITLLEVVSDLGMKATVIYESERGVTRRVQTAFTLNIAFTVVLTLIAVALAPFVARFFDVEADTLLFVIAAADLLLKGLGNIHDSLLLRDMEFRRRIVSQLVANVVRGGGTIVLALAGLGASALVLGFIAGTAAWTASLWLLKPFRPTFEIDRTAVRGVAAYGGWASILDILAGVGQRIDVAVIGGILGSRALGFYTIAQRIPELVVGNLTWSLSTVAFPALSQRRLRGARVSRETTLTMVRYSALFGLTTGVALAVLAPTLIVVLFSAKWAEAGPIMQPLAIMYGLICIVFPLGDTFKALGKQRVMAAVNAVALPVSIGAMVLAAPAGVVAVAWTRVAVTVGLGLFWILLMARTLDIRLSTIAGCLRPGVVTAIAVAVAGLGMRAAVPGTSIGPLVVSALACVAGGALALRVFARDEYLEARQLVTRRIPWRGRPLPARVVAQATANTDPGVAPGASRDRY